MTLLCLGTLMVLSVGAQAPDDSELPAIEHMIGNVAPTNSMLMKDCGAYCVAIVGSRSQEKGVGFEQARELVDPEMDGICSLADLVRGLANLGIESVPMESDDKRIPSGLNILHVRSSEASKEADHFIVSEELEDGRFRFYAPPLGTRKSDGRQVRKMWGGRFVHVTAEDGDRGSLFVLFGFAGLFIGGLVVWLVSRGSAEIGRAA